MQLRSIHNRELRAELERFSEYLDIRRSSIFISGWSYNIFHSSPPHVSMALYLIPNCNNRETIVWIRDRLILFFENNNWENRGEHGYLHFITTNFFFEENGRIIGHTAARSHGIWYWGTDSTTRVLTLDEIKGNR
jgi:hypothetical protein